MESFGASLKREREQRNITLEDISVSTKIGTRFLRALEEEHFDQLPGGIFNKGFVRAYARHLGIDEEQAIAGYLEASGANQPEPKPEEAPVLEVRAPRPGSAVDQLPWGTVALALLVVALVFAGWGFYSREKSAAPIVQIPSPVKVKRAAATAPSAELKNVSASPAAPKENPATDKIVPAPQTPAPAANASESMPAGSAAPSNPVPGAFVVLIKAREDSWISIIADGKQILEDTLQAPLEKAVEARNKIVVRTGNAGALDFSFNGKKLPVQGDYGEVKTLTFGANGLQPIPARTDPVSNN